MEARHDHGSMDMGSMDMNMDTGDSAGMFDEDYFPILYWKLVGGVIAAFTLANIIQWLLYWQRMHAARNGKPTPSIPQNLFTTTLTSFTSVLRELSNVTVPSFTLPRLTARFLSPTLGTTSLVLVYFGLLMLFSFYGLDTTSRWQFEDCAFRVGHLALAQLPLVILLAGKNNIVGLLTGHSYERLNWVHRWISRCLFVTITIHFGWWLAAWAPYDNYITESLTTNVTAQRGLAAWCILAWTFLSSFGPVRNLGYEFFVIQHIISFVGFFVMVWYHIPVDHRTWVYVPAGFYVFDRLVRWLYMGYNNLSIFHSRKQQQQSESLDTKQQPSQPVKAPIWANNATFTPLTHNMTRITINNPPMSWKPGQHAFLSCQTLAPLQSHPFTISSLPSDGKLQFLVRAHKGASRSYLRHAEKALGLPTAESQNLGYSQTVPVAIDGPYGRMRPLHQFDTVALFAGSTGVTFTLPLLRDIVHRWQRDDACVTRRVRFIWAVKSREQISWFARELADVADSVRSLRKAGRNVSVRLGVYVTCDEAFTADYNDRKRRRSCMAIRSSVPSLPTTTPPANEEKKEDDIVAVREVGSSSSNSSIASPPAEEERQPQQQKSCGPNGTCCCRGAAGDSDADVVCHCNDHPDPSSSTSLDKQVPGRDIHESIHLHNGRPVPFSLVNAELNGAPGETAVVACGPRSMNADVRAAVVKLSDARGVGKGGVAGLGDQGRAGVWFWGEGFGW